MCFLSFFFPALKVKVAKRTVFKNTVNCVTFGVHTLLLLPSFFFCHVFPHPRPVLRAPHCGLHQPWRCPEWWLEDSEVPPGEHFPECQGGGSSEQWEEKKRVARFCHCVCSFLTVKFRHLRMKRLVLGGHLARVQVSLSSWLSHSYLFGEVVGNLTSSFAWGYWIKLNTIVMLFKCVLFISSWKPASSTSYLHDGYRHHYLDINTWVFGSV